MLTLFSIPQKRTFEVNMSPPLRSFIVNTFGDKDDYSFAVEGLNQLRTNALITCSKSEKLSQMTRYYDQMIAIKNKLPISENQIRVSFKWQDAFDKGSLLGGKRTLSLSKAGYEHTCVLFNIGALMSEIACEQQLSEDEGLKKAVKMFQMSAGVFKFLKENTMQMIGSDPTPDLFPQASAFLSTLMLAQAQELILQKSTQDQMNNSVISKIANQCGFLYGEAYKLSQTEHNKDLFTKHWLATINAKQYMFQALAEYHQAQADSKSKQFGVALCRLIQAMSHMQVANQKAGTHFEIKEISERIRRAHDSAKKDNDYIYHERVSSYKSLDPIGTAALSKPIDIKFPMSENFRDMFSLLVPLEVNQAMTSFSSKRAEISNQEINRLRESTNLLNAMMASLNLPAEIEDISDKKSLPRSLSAKAAEVRAEGGDKSIELMLCELPQLLTRNKEILDVSIRMLDDEDTSDNELRQQFREKWTRTPSSTLTALLRQEANKYKEVINVAVNADHIVRDKYNKNKNYIILLTKSKAELESTLPASSPLHIRNQYIVKELQRLCEEVETLKAERQVIESELNSQPIDAMQADFINSFSARPNVDQGLLIAEKLEECYQPLKQQVSDSLARQEQLVSNIQRAHLEFSKERSASSPGFKHRSDLLTNMSVAYDTYKELMHNLKEGTKFYNDLTPLLLKFQSKISDFCFARKTEKDELFKDIQHGILSNSQTNSGIPPPHPAQDSYQPTQNQPGFQSSQVCAVPYPVSNQFGIMPSLPVSYNPYNYYGSDIPYPTSDRGPNFQHGGS
ncbi:hypothetical protein GJ496_000680 [Pomphorhynchus laevis]|nr:hypothetical protein GJ496_000680 [Pomphorhynchus laevis]